MKERKNIYENLKNYLHILTAINMISNVYSTIPFIFNQGGGYFFKKVPTPIPTVCMDRVYRQRVNHVLMAVNMSALLVQ